MTISLSSLPAVAAGLLLTVCLAGCGGGPGSPSTGATGTGGSSGTLTEAQRSAAIQAVQTQWQSLAHQDLQSDAKTMVDFIKTRSEFQDVGVGDDLAVWAHFKDGLPFVVFTNQPDDPSKSVTPITRAHTELPSSAAVRLYNVDTPEFTGSSDIRSALSGMFTARKYTVATGTGSLDDLKSVQGTGSSGVSVLFTNTHGCYYKSGAKPTDAQHFCMLTSTPVDPAHMTADIQDDLAHERLVYSANGRYCITGAWVQKYMTFGANSVWINNACEGFDQEFREACFHRGLITYIGWDRPVNRATANRAALYMVDRLTGANQATQDPVSPPQRPFDLDSVITDMSRQNPSLTHSHVAVNIGPFAIPGTEFDADLHVADDPFYPQPPSTFGQFAPSISFVEIDQYAKEVRVRGLFGTDPGAAARAVTLGGSPLTVTSWSPTLIKTALPNSASASGDFIVSVRGHPSNTVPITQWNVTVSLKAQYLNQGTQQFSATWNLKFRGDIHGFRNTPSSTPLPIGWNGVAWDDSSASYSAGGEQVVSHATQDDPSRRDIFDWTTTGTGTLAYAFDSIPLQGSNGTGGFAGLMSIDPKAMTMTIKASASMFGGITVTDTHIGTDGGATNSQPMDMMANADALPQLFPIQLKLDSSGNIVGGDASPKTWTSPTNVLYTLTWTVTPNGLPTSSTPRSARVQ